VGAPSCHRVVSDSESPDVDPTVVEWLLDSDPAIRWQALRDLAEASPKEIDNERRLITTRGWGARLLALQDPGGTWGGGLYSPKWTSTTYTLLLLRRFGLDPNESRAELGVQRIWDGARYFDGGLTPAITIKAPEACATSMYLALAYYFGVDHPKVGPALDWLLANQLPDGGWNCRTVRFGDRHSSFHTSILALEALDEAQAKRPDRTDISTAMANGREFFLRHRLYKSQRTGAVANSAFTKLSFPPRWHYDLLRGLEHFAVTDAPNDDRYADAIEILNQRRRRDGTWPVQNRHAGRVWFDMEHPGQPSRWNTLRALRVMRWHHDVGRMSDGGTR